MHLQRNAFINTFVCHCTTANCPFSFHKFPAPLLLDIPLYDFELKSSWDGMTWWLWSFGSGSNFMKSVWMLTANATFFAGNRPVLPFNTNITISDLSGCNSWDAQNIILFSKHFYSRTWMLLGFENFLHPLSRIFFNINDEDNDKITVK